jgi:SAM-dependent methyltransferase
MINPALSNVSKDLELIEANRQFYDPLWTDARLVSPERFNTWPLVSSLISQSQTRLEIAPGLRPRLPIQGTHFVDISAPAVAKLQAHGANAMQGLVSALPFEDGIFGLVCAFDIVEHVDDDEGALSELSRVAAPGATLLLSVPSLPNMILKSSKVLFTVCSRNRHACLISACGFSPIGVNARCGGITMYSCQLVYASRKSSTLLLA